MRGINYEYCIALEVSSEIDMGEEINAIDITQNVLLGDCGYGVIDEDTGKLYKDKKSNIL